MVAWLRPRAAAVRSLRLRGSADLEGALVPVAEPRLWPANPVVEQPRIHDFTSCAPLLACAHPWHATIFSPA